MGRLFFPGDVEHRWRAGAQWLSERKTALQDVLRLESIGVELEIAELYARVRIE
jgi:hypothetical protein